jgi:hypothetical protein
MGWSGGQRVRHAGRVRFARAGVAEGADERAVAGEEFGGHGRIGRREGEARGQAAGGEDGGRAVGIEGDETLGRGHGAVFEFWQFGGPPRPALLPRGEGGSVGSGSGETERNQYPVFWIPGNSSMRVEVLK